MMIDDDGSRIGSISGGCLEQDVVERARKVIVSGKPAIVNYDTSTLQDIVFGTGSGCNGVVRILIEPIFERDETGYLNFIEDCLAKRQKIILATVCESENSETIEIGARFAFSKTSGKETFFNRIVDWELASSVVSDARRFFERQESKFRRYELQSGFVEVVFEMIQPPIQLFAFGAGEGAIPVTRFAKELGWKVVVVDHRSAFATSERFETADEIIVANVEQFREKLCFDDKSAAVVMTHNFLRDVEILKFFLSHPLRYIGLIGSKGRAAKVYQALAEESLTQFDLSGIHSPIGIDLGAEAPAEIALSIVAEIQAVMNNRTGGLLKNWLAPLHDRALEIKSRKPNTEFLTEREACYATGRP